MRQHNVETRMGLQTKTVRESCAHQCAAWIAFVRDAELSADVSSAQHLGLVSCDTRSPFFRQTKRGTRGVGRKRGQQTRDRR